jgi:glycosyltransferase involved in cell wall biosynthesis
MMRILLITHFLPPNFNAGTEHYTLGLAKELLGRGHEVQIICAEDWQTGESYWNGVTEEVFEGVHVLRIHLNWLKAGDPNKILYDSLQVEKWLERFLMDARPDVVHVTSTMSLGVGVLRSVKRAGIPLIVSLMDFWFVCPSVQLLRSDGSLCDGETSPWDCQACLLAGSHLFQRVKQTGLPETAQAKLFASLSQINPISKIRGLRGMLLDMTERKQTLQDTLALADRILTHSDIVQTMVSRNINVRIDVLRNGQSLPWMGEPYQKAVSNACRFGYIGQIEKIKGVHILIAAFQQAAFGEQACLEIWGDLNRNPAYVQTLVDLREGNPSIHLRGRFNRDELAGVLSEIDVLVVPSIWYENSPLVIQEAFAANIPVITSNLGGMAEAVTHEVNGLLFERGDAADLARQMKRVAEEHGVLNRLRAGIPEVKSVQAEVDELENIYTEILTNANGVGKL